MTPEEMADRSQYVMGRVEIPSGRRRGNRQPGLRAAVLDIMKNPAPLLAEGDAKAIMAELKGQGLLAQDAKAVFPTCASTKKSPQPFYTAPGSGWNSHHIYPGGAGNAHGPQRCLLQGPVRQLCRYVRPGSSTATWCSPPSFSTTSTSRGSSNGRRMEPAAKKSPLPPPANTTSSASPKACGAACPRTVRGAGLCPRSPGAAASEQLVVAS